MLKKVISASRRTDIPAFYLPWMMNGFRAGFIDVPNPMYPKNSTRVDTSPQAVEWIVFWSRNYGVYLKQPEFFADYRQFFHFTILTHHPLLEKHHLAEVKALRQVEELARLHGAEKITWRYDPLVFWREGDSLQTNFDPVGFEWLAREIGRIGIQRCYFSIATDYAKFTRRFQRAWRGLELLAKLPAEAQRNIQLMQQICRENGLQLSSCCNDALVGDGIARAACISGRLFNQLGGAKTVSEAKAPGRKDCGCSRSVDIGNYEQQPCYFGCIYCYANPVGW
jgi:hypothetical protein